MSPQRRCTRTGCSARAAATLTYAYADSMAVVGPLVTYAEPHSFDLCERHAATLTVPLGWEVVHLEGDEGVPDDDDLEAIAEAVRERRPSSPGQPPVEVMRRGHLRVLRSPQPS